MLKETILVILLHRTSETTSRGELCHACASQQNEMNSVRSEQCSANLLLKAFRYLFHELPRHLSRTSLRSPLQTLNIALYSSSEPFLLNFSPIALCPIYWKETRQFTTSVFYGLPRQRKIVTMPPYAFHFAERWGIVHSLNSFCFLRIFTTFLLLLGQLPFYSYKWGAKTGQRTATEFTENSEKGVLQAVTLFSRLTTP